MKPVTSEAEIREEDRLWMAVDPETREALRLGTGPAEAGPAFFSSEEALREYCTGAGVERYMTHEVPASILPRMRGKPFWLEGRRCTVEEAAQILRNGDREKESGG